MNSFRQRITALVYQEPLIRPDLSKQIKKLVVQRFIAVNILTLLMQYIGLTISTLSSLYSPLWLASGTACAFVFLRGASVLPGIWLGSFLAYLMANIGMLAAAACATILTLQAYLILVLSYRYISRTLIFYQTKRLLRFIFLAAAITAMSSYALIIIAISKLPSNINVLSVYLQWWLANFNGLIIFAFAIVTWDAFFAQIYQLKNQIHALLALFALLSFISLSSYQVEHVYIIAVMVFILTAIISVKFKWCGAVAALLLQGLFLSMTTLFDPTAFFSNGKTVLSLEFFIAIEISFALLITSRLR
jgi:integral membrane sensor domain MASE1